MGGGTGISPGKLATLAAALLTLAPATARADSASCSYDPPNHTATITVTPGPGSGATSALFRFGDGKLFVDGGESPPGPCGAADNENTDTVVVNNSSTTAALRSVFYIYSAGPFREGPAPGFTDEPGSSDEIEFNVNLRRGGTLGLQLDPDANVVLGGNRINLNADEANGIDADVTVNGATGSSVTPWGTLILGSGTPDSILGRGGAGTPATPFLVGMDVLGGDGHDLILGGRRRDRLIGDNGPDVLKGRGGKDRLRGGLGADAIFGGRQNDHLRGEPGRDVLNGGPGRRDFCAPGDRRIRCELPRR